jgi:hypothetical protein
MSAIFFYTRPYTTNANTTTTKHTYIICNTMYMHAIYTAEDFTTAGKICATKGVLNEQLGLDCYIDIGE